MLRRPLAALAAALSTVAVVVLPTAGPAEAAGTCTLAPPARIAIYQEAKSYPVTVTGDCQPNGYGFWSMSGSDNYAELDTDYSSAGVIDVFDQMARYGRQAWVPDEAGTDSGCVGAACGDLTQNRPFSDVRLGGYASLTATRSGSRVTFTAGSGGWSPTSHKLVPRPNLSGEIQTQYGDSSWHRVGKSVRTGSNAKVTVSFTVASARTYRFALYSTATYFDRASTPVSR